MLSAQTKDEVTAKAVGELQKLPLEIDKILETDEETISKLIYPVSFYKVWFKSILIFRKFFTLNRIL